MLEAILVGSLLSARLPGRFIAYVFPISTLLGKKSGYQSTSIPISVGNERKIEKTYEEQKPADRVQFPAEVAV
jgi:hypothetical protein